MLTGKTRKCSIHNLTKYISHEKVPVLSNAEDGLQECVGIGYVYPIYNIDGFNKESFKQGTLKALICFWIFHISTLHRLEILVRGSGCKLQGCIRGIFGSLKFQNSHYNLLRVLHDFSKHSCGVRKIWIFFARLLAMSRFYLELCHLVVLFVLLEYHYCFTFVRHFRIAWLKKIASN